MTLTVPEIKVGTRVRCWRTGEVGTVVDIRDLQTPSGNTLPAMVFIQQDEAGKGIIRDRNSLEVLRDQ